MGGHVAIVGLDDVIVFASAASVLTTAPMQGPQHIRIRARHILDRKPGATFARRGYLEASGTCNYLELGFQPFFVSMTGLI